jgi:hypothetical protein
MKRFLTLTAFVALLGGPLARAEFVGGTYNPAALDNVFSAGAPLLPGNGFAQEFTISEDVLSLSKLTLPLRLDSGTDTSGFSFEIRANAFDGPTGPALYTGDLGSSLIGATFGAAMADLSPTGSGDLAAGNYWLVLNSSSPSAVLTWGSVTGTGATTDPSAFSVGSSPWTLTPGTTYGMALDGELTPAPEPGQIAMGAILFTCIGGITLYQRKANAKKACADRS